ncbi:hypothetical protein [Streptomyces sp. NPDC058620]|uniref:VG15 protein n=1 Tax=Streptomyces sp. NPDC058620 TaxID=3346560 RepID=UPI00364E8E02
MSPSPLALAHQAARERLSQAAGRAAVRLWRQTDPQDIRGSWLPLLARLLVIVSGAQLAAAESTESWLTRLLGDEDPDRPDADQLNPAMLAGVSGEGLPLADVLAGPMWAAFRMVTAGAPVAQAMARGSALLDIVARTAVADAGRAADQVGMVTRPSVTAYIRVTESGACSRCLVLAGKEYGTSTGFLRHPRCQCGMEPVTRDHRPTAQDPRKLVDSMSDAQRRKTFGEAGAKALAEGADLGLLVNARRGMETATVFGRKVLATTEGTTARGIAGKRLQNLGKADGQRYRVSRTPRLMPEEIFRLADNRAHAVRLLRQHAYIF